MCTIWQKGGFVRDFENFNFLHLEMRRTREKRFPVQSGVVGVVLAKAVSVTIGGCAAVIPNTNVTKVWTAFGITIDCVVPFFGLQRKSPRREVVRILQCEKETLQTRVAFSFPELLESHITGVNPPNMFPFVSRITVRVFGCPSQRL
jgi:hypothetical protein